MKIALLGYGKMGHAIEEIAVQRGHEIVLKINDQNLEDLTKENIQKADVAIEFTNPDSAVQNILFCLNENVAVVCGTTGWLNQLNTIRGKMQRSKRKFFVCKQFQCGR